MVPESMHCLGQHSVAGSNGCHNDACKGKRLCAAGCAGCPDFRAAWPSTVNVHCNGDHPVKGGCENLGCRGLKLCQRDCVTCPDFVASFGHNAAHRSLFCRGDHGSATNGPCANPACSDRKICVAGCTLCSHFQRLWGLRTNTLCRGAHAVTGGCENEACRGQKLCLPDCMRCPDAVDLWGTRGSLDSSYCTGLHKQSGGGDDDCPNPVCKRRSRCITGCIHCPDFKSKVTTPNYLCDGHHGVCGNVACEGRARCWPDCTRCPTYSASYGKDGVADSPHCKGRHTSESCTNVACKGRKYCRAGCTGCPDFRRVWQQLTNTVCTGQHSVAGGCEYQGCKGRRYCLPDCTTCPDFVERFGIRTDLAAAAPLVPVESIGESPQTVPSAMFSPPPVSSDGGLLDTMGHDAGEKVVMNQTPKPAADLRQYGDRNRFSILRNHVLGEGGFGVVYKAFDNVTGEFVAAKESKGGQQTAQADELLAEFEVVKSFEHPNIVKVLDFIFEVDGRARIVMDWMPSGSVQSILNSTGFRFHERVIRRYIREALLGLAFLHAQGFLHRDIKPGNMLVSGSGSVKLSDFGTCQQYSATADAANCGGMQIGTPCFMSPEVVSMGWYSPGSDMWAIGCSIVQMASGHAPWSHIPTGMQTPIALVFRIATAAPPDHHPLIPPHLSNELKDILERLFDVQPDKRPTAAELLVDPYFAARNDAPLPASAESLQDFQVARAAAEASAQTAVLTLTGQSSFLFLSDVDVEPLSQ